MQAVALIEAPWREPLGALAAFADAPWAFGLVGRGEHARWAYLGRDPDATLLIGAEDPRDPFAELAALAGEPAPARPDGPPFQGGVVGLAAYELGDRVEPLGLQRLEDWPDLACARYPAILAFDQVASRLWAIGRGKTDDEALARARSALGWLAAPAAPAAAASGAGASLEADDPAAYEHGVAEIVGRIAAGEIFQANLSRRWRGRLAQGSRPFDTFARLHLSSSAPYAAWLRLPDRVLASNSPEQFLEVAGRLAQTRPIKGTAPRGADAGQDRALAEALAVSPKDRAENLMIVDLMRNDLAKVCAPGTVAVPELFAVETFANVHHLVSTVTGVLEPGRSAVDLLRAAFPPGSITGAPKIQAMRVIAGLEAPRGPFFGSVFRLGFDGGLDSSVLIRTAAFVEDHYGWRVEARAGAGVVADSVPASERAETEAKIAALARALTGY